MIRVRNAAERGHFNHGWLDTYHTFSFGDYYDPAHMGFRSLQVINDDRVHPGQGFGMHGHRDMEIVTYVLDGALQHQDSLGNGSIIRAGELQRMTAGTGVRHSEFNPSDKEWVHLYQIWLLPERKGLKPSYEELALGEAQKRGQFRLVAHGFEGDHCTHILWEIRTQAHLDRIDPPAVFAGQVLDEFDLLQRHDFPVGPGAVEVLALW